MDLALDWRSGVPPGFHWPEGIRAAACFTFDLDVEDVILSDQPDAASWVDVMSHQAYGPRTGAPRILRLLEGLAIRGTFFIPGYTAERWPAIARAIRDAGHEIGHHGYMHETSRGATPEQEEARLLRGLAALDSVIGIRPTGYRAPWWAVSPALPGLLVKHGFGYDSSLMDADHPYILSTAPDGAGTSIVELPIQWALDDWEPYVFLPDISGSGVIARPSEIAERWIAELDALYRAGGLFVLTCHPFVSGRASRAEALASVMEHARALEGLWIATAEEIAAWTRDLGLTPISFTTPNLPIE